MKTSPKTTTYTRKRQILDATIAAAVLTVAPLIMVSDATPAANATPGVSITQTTETDTITGTDTGDLNAEIAAARAAAGAPPLTAHPTLDRLALNAAINSTNIGQFIPANTNTAAVSTGADRSADVEKDLVETTDPTVVLDTLKTEGAAVMNDKDWTHYGSGYVVKDGLTTLKIVYATYDGSDGTPSEPAGALQTPVELHTDTPDATPSPSVPSTPSTPVPEVSETPVAPSETETPVADDTPAPVLDDTGRIIGYAVGAVLALLSIWAWAKTWKARVRLKNTNPVEPYPSPDDDTVDVPQKS